MKGLKKGIKVKVIAGKDKGKESEVKKVLPSKHQLIVVGINVFKKHNKPANGSEGGINEVELPIDCSNVKIINSNGKLKAKKKELVQSNKKK